MTSPWTTQALRRIALCALGAALMISAGAQAQTSNRPGNSAPDAVPPIVQTGQGPVSGKLISGVRAYLGIPYAAPPVGELRWQPPQPPARWSGTRDGSAFGDRCAQPLSPLSPESANEDCLFLNVHVPDGIGREKLPVMVWIHGGAFLSGSAAEYDMTKLAQKARAVVVSINYRLGAFGFLRQPELVAQNTSSNLGLQDQQAALRWVESQIGRFGGDASRVTIFGHSAGSVSVCLHMVSPQSKGLFHRAILQSGACHLLTATPAAVMQAQTVALGVKLGCPEGPGQLSCMRQKPALDVMRQSVPNGNEVNGVDLRWTPVQDGITLKGDPDQLVQQGKFHRVPVLVGTTHDEGRLFVASEYHLANLAPVNEADVNAHIGRITPPDSTLAARLRSTYTAQAYGTLDLAFSALLTDHYFACDAMRDAEAFSRHVPTYNYEFTEPSASNPDPLMPLGAFHGLELIYLFQNNQVMPESMDALSGAQLKLSEQMIRYWGRFAAMGHPNAFLPPYWPRFKARQPSSLNLNSKSLAVFGTAAFRKDHQCAVLDPN